MTVDVLDTAIFKYKTCLKDVRKYVRQQLKDIPAYAAMQEWERVIISQGGTIPEDED